MFQLSTCRTIRFCWGFSEYSVAPITSTKGRHGTFTVLRSVQSACRKQLVWDLLNIQAGAVLLGIGQHLDEGGLLRVIDTA